MLIRRRERKERESMSDRVKETEENIIIAERRVAKDDERGHEERGGQERCVKR